MAESDTPTILVQNKTARMLGPSYKTETGGAILRLLPGLNRVPADLWKQVTEGDKPGSMLNQHLANDLVVVLEDKADIKALPVTRAVELVGGTYDKALLKAWEEGEDRPPVIEAIGAQLDKLDGSKEEPEPETQPATGGTSPLGPATGVDVSAPRRGSRRR